MLEALHDGKKIFLFLHEMISRRMAHREEVDAKVEELLLRLGIYVVIVAGMKQSEINNKKNC